jgi:putative membrane protein
MKESTALRTIYIISGAIFAAVVTLFCLPKAENIPSFVSFLPKLNAILNGTTFLVLLIAHHYIKKKKVSIHKRLNILAFSLSTIFLLSYVTFHSFGVETKFPSDNPLKPVYLFILITHIFCAALVLPLVLISLYRGLAGQFAKHKKITKWSYPIWLYVTATGVIVYLMISPYYKF